MAWESGPHKVNPSTDYADFAHFFPNQVLAQTVLQLIRAANERLLVFLATI